jgi:hypothetical protein
VIVGRRLHHGDLPSAEFTASTLESPTKPHETAYSGAPLVFLLGSLTFVTMYSRTTLSQDAGVSFVTCACSVKMSKLQPAEPSIIEHLTPNIEHWRNNGPQNLDFLA